MKKQIILNIFLIALINSFTIQSSSNYLPINDILKAGQIIPGHGYSMDRQAVSSIACFRVKPSPYSKSESVIRFDQGSAFSEIEKSLRVDVSVKVGIGIFSVEADVNFMKEIKDTEFSMSINYYQYVQSEITLDMGYGPAGALTQDGLRVYGSDQKPNPRFGLICGDRFISSFKVGANVIFSLKLHFQSKSDKSTFQVKFGVKFGSFVSIAADIQAIARATNVNGRVQIMAYQSGGNPAQLAKLLNSTCGSAYCAASCSLTNMNDCIGVMNGLLKYASTNFPNQVNLQDPKTVTPFSTGFADMQDIKWLGLTTPKSYVTKDVAAMRQKLANTLLANQYYMDALTLLSKTTFNWDKNSTLFKTILNIPSEAKLNIQYLMDQIEGGILCYKDPEACIQNGDIILSKLKPVEEQAKYVLDKIKYKLQTDICTSTFFYRISDQKWYSPKSSCTNVTAIYFNASQILLSFNITANANYDGYRLHVFTTIGSLIAVNQTAPYEGSKQQTWTGGNKTTQIKVPRTLSEYAYQLYK